MRGRERRKKRGRKYDRKLIINERIKKDNGMENSKNVEGDRRRVEKEGKTYKEKIQRKMEWVKLREKTASIREKKGSGGKKTRDGRGRKKGRVNEDVKTEVSSRWRGVSWKAETTKKSYNETKNNNKYLHISLCLTQYNIVNELWIR